MKKLFLIVTMLFLGVLEVSAQQESQYSQYMYNTMTFNPGYTGSRDVISAMGLYRTQWVGLDGAPKTMNFSLQAPLGEHSGIGLNVVSDQIGPTKNSGFMLNYAYTIVTGSDLKISFGIAGGFDNFEVDYTKLRMKNPDIYMTGKESQFSPNIGAGIYVHDYNWYVGVSIPKLLKTDHYNDDIAAPSVYTSKSHIYGIAGYVFDINPYLRFKPAVLAKIVPGAPLAFDFSANFLINEKFTVGGAYRLSAGVSALAGFQVTDAIQVGYGYDYDTSKLGNYNSGSHELFLRFDILNKSIKQMINPRFF